MVTGGGLCCGQVATANTVLSVDLHCDYNVFRFGSKYIYIEYNPVTKILINEVYMTKGALSLQSVAPGKEV